MSVIMGYQRDTIIYEFSEWAQIKHDFGENYHNCPVEVQMRVSFKGYACRNICLGDRRAVLLCFSIIISYACNLKQATHDLQNSVAPGKKRADLTC